MSSHPSVCKCQQCFKIIKVLGPTGPIGPIGPTGTFSCAENANDVQCEDRVLVQRQSITGFTRQFSSNNWEVNTINPNYSLNVTESQLVITLDPEGPLPDDSFIEVFHIITDCNMRVSFNYKYQSNNSSETAENLLIIAGEDVTNIPITENFISGDFESNLKVGDQLSFRISRDASQGGYGQSILTVSDFHAKFDEGCCQIVAVPRQEIGSRVRCGTTNPNTFGGTTRNVPGCDGDIFIDSSSGIVYEYMSETLYLSTVSGKYYRFNHITGKATLLGDLQVPGASEIIHIPGTETGLFFSENLESFQIFNIFDGTLINTNRSINPPPTIQGPALDSSLWIGNIIYGLKFDSDTQQTTLYRGVPSFFLGVLIQPVVLGKVGLVTFEGEIFFNTLSAPRLDKNTGEVYVLQTSLNQGDDPDRQPLYTIDLTNAQLTFKGYYSPGGNEGPFTSFFFGPDRKLYGVTKGLNPDSQTETGRICTTDIFGATTCYDVTNEAITGITLGPGQWFVCAEFIPQQQRPPQTTCEILDPTEITISSAAEGYCSFDNPTDIKGCIKTCQLSNNDLTMVEMTISAILQNMFQPDGLLHQSCNGIININLEEFFATHNFSTLVSIGAVGTINMGTLTDNDCTTFIPFVSNTFSQNVLSINFKACPPGTTSEISPNQNVIFSTSLCFIVQ